MKYIITVRREIDIESNEYPYNITGTKALVESYIGEENWTNYLTGNMAVLAVIQVSDEQEKRTPYGDIEFA